MEQLEGTFTKNLIYPADAVEGRVTINHDGQDVIPRKVNHKVAERWADLTGIANDIQQVLECCDLLVSVGDDGPMKKALQDSALIRYRRCFASGVRERLDISELFDNVGALTLHKDLIALADKHVAHSVNALDGNYSYLLIDSAGELLMGGVLTYTATPGAPTVVQPLQTICKELASRVKSLQEIEAKKFDELARRMTPSERLDLPYLTWPINLQGAQLKESKKRARRSF